uniref:Potassium/proton antiporter CemA n=1 Tax=Chlorotetraedron incus TaxID=162317 RepID=A0A140HAC7_9CHLO|nr:chloroplast envelope membrane protein [Chlorotetraedron incus]AMO01126.1 chloroplast envelope membrane protein [Chlorotetraedron incus]
MNSDLNDFRNTENSYENKKKNDVSLNPKKSNNNSSNSRFGFPFDFWSGAPKGSQKQKEIPKQQVVSITYEEIGLFPRSFNRVFDRFFKQLFFDVENLVIQEYRFYRYLFLTTVKCVFILVFVPLSVNFIAKNYFVRPITEYYWNTHQTEIFLNSYQQKRAFTELKNFEEKIYFESLIFPSDSPEVFEKNLTRSTDTNLEETSGSKIKKDSINLNLHQETVNQNRKFSKIFTQSIQTSLQTQTVELAKHYNEESIEAITNFFADFISLSTLFVLLFHLEIQINITKSFLLEVFFGLDDSKKSLLILFVTDLLVGYHSPNIWELFFSTIFDHYGLPESQTTIFLLVATLPVLLDVLFKYLIFRHLNRASPATVATYHAMIE